MGWPAHKLGLNTAGLGVLLAGRAWRQQKLLVAWQRISPGLNCKVIGLRELLLHAMTLKPRCYTNYSYYVSDQLPFVEWLVAPADEIVYYLVSITFIGLPG